MGDMADYYLAQQLDEMFAEEDNPSEPEGPVNLRRPKTVTCKHCNTPNLFWTKTPKGWRLWDLKTIHSCFPTPELMNTSPLSPTAVSQMITSTREKAARDVMILKRRCTHNWVKTGTAFDCSGCGARTFTPTTFKWPPLPTKSTDAPSPQSTQDVP